MHELKRKKTDSHADAHFGLLIWEPGKKLLAGVSHQLCAKYACAWLWLSARSSRVFAASRNARDLAAMRSTLLYPLKRTRMRTFNGFDGDGWCVWGSAVVEGSIKLDDWSRYPFQAHMEYNVLVWIYMYVHILMLMCTAHQSNPSGKRDQHVAAVRT